MDVYPRGFNSLWFTFLAPFRWKTGFFRPRTRLPGGRLSLRRSLVPWYPWLLCGAVLSIQMDGIRPSLFLHYTPADWWISRFGLLVPLVDGSFSYRKARLLVDPVAEVPVSLNTANFFFRNLQCRVPFRLSLDRPSQGKILVFPHPHLSLLLRCCVVYMFDFCSFSWRISFSSL